MAGSSFFSAVIGSREKESDAATFMTLWRLLLVFCFVAPFTTAAQEASHANLGFGVYAVAITFGLALGACCFCTMNALGKAVYLRSKQQPDLQREWTARIMYFTATLWIVVAAFLGWWLTGVLLRFVS